MSALLIALGAGVAFIVAYHTYGRWLGSKIFRLTADIICPSQRLRDDTDYVPTPKSVVFGHHFTSIAGTGPIVGPAIAVMWGWLPALLWVVFGSIFIGAVHDLGALVVSLRNNGQTVGDIAGRVLNKRVRLLFLFILFMALTIVLAIFGLVIANVFDLYPATIFPVWIQLPIAIGVGVWLHRRGKGLFWPSIIALALMYLTVIFGDQNSQTGIAFFDQTIGGALHAFNTWFGGQQGVVGDGLHVMVWVVILLIYSYIASVLPVWVLLQPRDYINSLQLISALGLIVVGLAVAAFAGGAPPVEGAERVPLEIAAPMVNWSPADAPLIFPFLFITVACGAVSGFHCLVSSGTSSKQLAREPDARFVGYGSMLTEGFLAVLVILACVAGLGLGATVPPSRGPISMINGSSGSEMTAFSVYDESGAEQRVVHSQIISLRKSSTSARFSDTGTKRLLRVEHVEQDGSTVALAKVGSDDERPMRVPGRDMWIQRDSRGIVGIGTGADAWNGRYSSWKSSGGLASTVGAFVDGSANFLTAMNIPRGVAVALMGVLVASFAGTTLDTTCRLQRYVVQELAATFLPARDPDALPCAQCGYDLRGNPTGACPECGTLHKAGTAGAASDVNNGPINQSAAGAGGPTVPALWPLYLLRNKHGASIFAVAIGALIAAMPTPGSDFTWANAGKGGLILWPMFGATNQLLAGLAFLVIAFWLWRRRVPVWFLIVPMCFMLVMPAWAMIAQLLLGMGAEPAWLFADQKNWVLIFIALATLALEAWMIVEAVLLWPKVRGVVEEAGGGVQSSN